jgi:hypothetical protein
VPEASVRQGADNSGGGAGGPLAGTAPPARGSPTAPTTASRAMPAMAPLLGRWLRAVGRFWWDFLVGDTPELTAGVAVAVALLAVLVKAYNLNAAAIGAFPSLVVLMLGASAYRARRNKP